MENKTAKIISFVLHPLYMTTIGVLYIININLFFSLILQVKLLLFGVTFFTTCILPATAILILKKTGMVKSIYLETREERRFPFIIVIMTNYLCFYILKDLLEKVYFYSPLINLFLIGVLICSFVATLINLKYKISIHMLAMGGLTGSLIGMSFVLQNGLVLSIIVSILLSGLVAYSRLKLKAHKQGEVYLGYITGLLIMSSIYIVQMILSLYVR